MKTARLFATAVAVALSAGSTRMAAQTISTTTATTSVTLKTFTPVDSVFVNPSVAQFTIALNNTVSGTPTEYRVSRFADFRDASWLPYSSKPSLVGPRTWFPTATSGSAQITLYLQVRAKNPMAGRPGSLIDGKLTVQPDFFFSEVLGRRIRTLFVG
jgi:hypothetical protein